eukprot:CAMPEP_0202859254 /NCGR_PEP_ID=MMETSP1391-20130828/1454_1 /ASSEMBLY_ACC=CAM_ASM_000867 /TAXON_ID=1034604 /ORGANISM="Chlamydomonas leiostraca, Strain SAG 11-49" /LENGTH=292 /DNA_ID=CAMNT_0049538275 /DNA_START=22 /DNA_END=896 /DNA_ORIENTATION=+
MSLLQHARCLARLMGPDLSITPAGMLRLCGAWSSTHAFHTSTAASDEQQKAPSSPPSAPTGPMAPSPLMNLDETLKQGLPSQQSSQDHWLQEPEDPRKRPERKWQWYDEADERKQQLMETSVARPYAGYAHLSNVPQSMKKMNRVLALVRGMYYDEALAQCKLFPHKAARYTEHVLDHAREDAERKGMNRDDLIIAMAYSTKGQYIKKRRVQGQGQRHYAHHAARARGGGADGAAEAGAAGVLQAHAAGARARHRDGEVEEPGDEEECQGAAAAAGTTTGIVTAAALHHQVW